MTYNLVLSSGSGIVGTDFQKSDDNLICSLKKHSCLLFASHFLSLFCLTLQFTLGFFPLCRWFDALRQLAKGSGFLAGRGDRDPTRLALGLRGRPCEPPRQRRGTIGRPML